MNRYLRILVFLAIAAVFLVPVLLLRRGLRTRSVPETRVIEGRMAAGDQLAGLLSQQGLAPDQVHGITRALQPVFNPAKCNIGDGWEITFDAQGNFQRFVYRNGPLDSYSVVYDTTACTYAGRKEPLDAERRVFGVRGKISSSLYGSMSSLNVNPETIIQFAEIFSSRVDFFTDCHSGDAFLLIWEAYTRNGEILKDIRVLAAAYTNQGKNHQAFCFRTPDNRYGYYDGAGKSIEGAFLKAPLNYRRISSYFSPRRMHPILRIPRPHLGIDYAAPMGTPVSAVGRGRVVFAGWSSGYGLNVRIQHPNGYTSYYGHLSRKARGVQCGRTVEKGQVIGYVGSTGLSTGPHLDFRVKKNGGFINFLRIENPPSYPVPQSCMEEFRKTCSDLQQQFQSLKENEIVLFPET